MCTGWLTPLPGFEYQMPNLAQALRREQMVVGVAPIDLEQVVVDILGRELRAHPRGAERREIEHHQRSCRVLGKGLVYADSDLLPRLHLPGHEIGLDELGRRGCPSAGHGRISPRSWHRLCAGNCLMPSAAPSVSGERSLEKRGGDTVHLRFLSLR